VRQKRSRRNPNKNSNSPQGKFTSNQPGRGPRSPYGDDRSGRRPARPSNNQQRRGGPTAHGFSSRRSSGGPSTLTSKDGRIVAGVHAVREALKVRPQAVTQIWIKNEADLAVEPLKTVNELAKRHQVQMHFKSGQQLDQICASHQGVVAAVSELPLYSGIRPGACYVILDQIEDPHNLGAMLRTGWLIGVDAFFIPDHHSVGLTPTVHKVATGACEHVPVQTVSNVKRLISELKEEGFKIVGLAGSGSSMIHQNQYPESVAFVIGSESDGMRRQTAESCDLLVKIPQSTSDASYNASVACAMVLGEWKRQKISLT
jgi:23S rRNA (guanosine2251-2'-O)-methyltransferase